MWKMFEKVRDDQKIELLAEEKNRLFDLKCKNIIQQENDIVDHNLLQQLDQMFVERNDSYPLDKEVLSGCHCSQQSTIR